MCGKGGLLSSLSCKAYFIHENKITLGILLGSPKNTNLKIKYMTKGNFSNAGSLQTFLKNSVFYVFTFILANSRRGSHMTYALLNRIIGSASPDSRLTVSRETGSMEATRKEGPFSTFWTHCCMV
jgi:hypothetical protein